MERLKRLAARPGVLDGVAFAGLVAVAFVLRVVNYSNIVGYPDEFTYLYRALSTLGYHWAWSRQFMLDQPPLYMYLLSVTTVTVNGQLDTFRMISVLSGALTIGFVYLLGKAIFNRETGLVAGIFMAFNGFDILYSRLAQEEALTILFMTASLYFFWTGVVGRRNLKRAVASGVLLGAAIDTKYAALLLPLTYLVYFLLAGQDWKNLGLVRKDWRAIVFGREFLAMLFVALLVFLPVAYELEVSGVNAFYWDLLGKFVNGYSPFYRSFNAQDLVVAALSSYSNLLSFVSSFNAPAVFPLSEIYSELTFFSLLGILVYFSYATLRLRRGEAFVTLLFGISALVFLIYPNRYQYYQLYTFPAYPIMFGLLFQRTRRRLSGRKGGSFRSARLSGAAPFVVLLLVLSMGVVAGTASAVSGQGANDRLLGFFQYVKANQVQNLSIGVTPVSGLNFVSYYLQKVNVTARIVELAGVGYASDPPSVRILEAPIRTNGTESLVITLQPLVLNRPQFVVLEQAEYQYTFTTSMKLWLAQNYQPLMNTPGFIIMQRDGFAMQG